MLTTASGRYVPKLEDIQVLYYSSALSVTSLLQSKISRRPNKRRCKKQINVLQALEDSGIAVVKYINSKLIETVSEYSQLSAIKQSRYQRQTELK